MDFETTSYGEYFFEMQWETLYLRLLKVIVK